MAKEYEKRICPVCNTEFMPKYHNAICCSEECKLKRRRAKEKAHKEHYCELAKIRERKKQAKKNHDKIADIAIAARKEGLTYGQYVANYMGKM